jgi:DNA-binding NtrC family response regulator
MSEDFYTARERLVSRFEREYLARLVGRAGQNMSKAARLASIDRTTLYRMLEKYGTRRQDNS